MDGNSLSSVTKTEVRDCVLMAFIVALGQSWVSLSFQSLNLYAGVTESEQVLNSVYLVSIVCISILLFFMGRFQEKAGKLLERSWVFWLASALMVLSGLLYSLATLPAYIGQVFILLGGVISALSSGTLLVYQGMLISRMHMRDVTVSVAAGTVLAILLFALSILLDPTLSLVFVIFLAAAYCVCLYFMKLNLDAGNSVKVVPLSEQRAIKNADENDNVMRLLLRMCLCCGIIGFVHELGRTLYIQINIVGSGMATYAGLQTVGAVITTLGAILVALALLSSQVQRMPFMCHRFVFLFLIVAALALPFPLIASQDAAFVGYSINQGAQQCFSLFMWVLTAALCQRLSGTRVRIFCYIRCAWAVGPLVGLLAGRFVCEEIGITAVSLYAVMAVGVICLVVAMSIVFNERVLQDTMGIIPIERRERFQEKCRKVIEKYGLSEREGEIMTMFAKGRNLAFIQDELCISKSTVSTHRQHIYKKLDIHSQQELLDLVQGMKI